MQIESTDIQKTIGFELSDGTTAQIAASAIDSLEHRFGIARGRIRRGKGGDTVMVRPTVCYGKPVPKPPKEVPLRDLLATWVYSSPELRNPEPGQTFILVDGDPRNLTPENIKLSELPEVAWPERKPRTKQAAEVSLSTQQLVDELAEFFPDMQSSIRKKIQRSKWQADEVLAQVVFELVRQIRNGSCPAKNKNELFVWASCSLSWAAEWKRNEIRKGRCLDLDHDRAEIRLLRVVRKSAELREAAGLSVDASDWMLPECVSTPALARMFEADAAAEEELERQRIKDERGSWKSHSDEYAAAGFIPGQLDKPSKDSDKLLTE